MSHVFAQEISDITLEDFQSYDTGSTPKRGWQARNGEPSKVYSIGQEGQNRFLRAKDSGQSVQFFRRGGWDIKTYPLLTWRWRVLRFPQGADERLEGKNDSAAGVYVVFPKRLFVPESIKYVWSAVVPEETLLRRNSRFPTVIVFTGEESKGQWVSMVRNVYQEYEKLFKRHPPKPVAIGFLTDANSVKGKAQADYDDLRVVKAPPQELFPAK